MPLRDHFHPPVSRRTSWEAFHGGWPMLIVMDLFARLPEGFDAEPRNHLSREAEIDVATYEHDRLPLFSSSEQHDSGAVAVRSATAPMLEIETELVDTDEFEVLVYDAERERRLVAAIEIISPANKDRAAHRQVLVSKCAALLKQRVSLVLIDLVTSRRANLYAELLALIGQSDPSPVSAQGALYAVSCRWIERGRGNVLQAWTHPLTLGQPLPTVPLWLTEDLWVPLELEVSYAEACRFLHIP